MKIKEINFWKWILILIFVLGIILLVKILVSGGVK